MRQVPLAVVFLLLIAGQVSAQDQIFSDDFEWGSICAWNNLWYPDNDSDEWGANGVAGISVSCPPPAGYVTVNGDCDDFDEFVFPGAMEVCDFFDNDCDPSTEDGFDELWLGDLCDGTDSDLCSEGVFDCLSGMQICEDTTGNTPDLCDDTDDDCNPATPDGANEPWFGSPCDGTDSDLCVEGTFECSGGSQTCSDNSGSSLDLCNGADDDCDPASADGSEDPLTGASCDGPDSDLCLEGINSCSAGSLQCSDLTGDNQEVCNGIDDDCDDETDENAPCNDNLSCTLDYCGGALGCLATIDSGKCLIDGVCYSSGQSMPGNPCLSCNSAGSQTTWSYNNGASCNDGSSCTSGDRCSGGECIGYPVLDSYEPNNSLADSRNLGSVNDNDAFPFDNFTATIYPESDLDWFRYHDNDTPTGAIWPRVELSNIPTGTDYDLCAYFKCDEPYTADLDCPIGIPSTYSGLPGCCSRNSGSADETVRLDPSCGGFFTDDDGRVYIRIEKVAGAATCAAYSVDWGDD